MTKSKKLPNKTVQPVDNDCMSKKKKKGKMKKSSSEPKIQVDIVDALMNHHIIRHGENHTKIQRTKIKNNDNFWSSTNNTEERQKIREFWLQLGEEERRSLVKLEKEAVLRKMKEQQKHSCNCSVCGKKRTAIEDELEVLYDAYYEELEQYANHQQKTLSSSSTALPINYVHGSTLYHSGYSHTLEEDEEQEEEDILDNEEEDDFDDREDSYHSLMSGYPKKSRFEETSHIKHTASTHSDNQSGFGNSLTVKGGILTVADDLLKNDGKNFLDMMERLAERRMQKEDASLNQDGNYFQEDEEEEEEVYEEEEEEDTRSEEQRMEEGRRMFQIFAARMFEQRVFAAYREKVAQERQQRLLEELEEEDRLREEKEAKKQLEKEKKKNKKRQLKKQQEEQRLAFEVKKKIEEEALFKQKEIEKQRHEKERLKKDEEKRQREEERLKKDEERKRKAKEEKEREKKRREKEERDRKEKREKEEKDRKEKEEKDCKEKRGQENVEMTEKEAVRLEPPQVNNTSSDFENRQQALIDALVGSPSNAQHSQPLLSLPHLHHSHSKPQQPPFMPISRHLGSPFLSTSLDHLSPLSDSNSILGVPNDQSTNISTSTRRSITPIGQPVGGQSSEDTFLKNNRAEFEGSTRSFFSNFLFGEQPIDSSTTEGLQDDRKFLDKSSNWRNGWTASSFLSDSVHGKLFGDALPDRTTVIIERAKVAYKKLNEFTKADMEYHTLVQLHCMMNDLYADFRVDIRELYDILSCANGFQCFHHNQGTVVLFDPLSSSLLLCNEFTNANSRK